MPLDEEDALNEFVAESLEHLSDVENQLLDMEAAGSDGDQELVNTVFRSVHSIKGGAGLLGITPVKDLAHHLEDVLGRIREQELAPTTAAVDALLQAADALRRMLGHVGDCDRDDVSEHLHALAALSAPATQQRPQGEDRSESLPSTSQQTTAVAALEGGTGAAPHGHAPVAGASAGADDAASLRVHVNLLSRLMDLAGELTLGRNEMLQALAVRDIDRLQSIGQRISLVTSDMQESIMRARMQPVGIILTRLPRLVRDLARSCGKEISLTIDGKDVEVDKAIIEGLADPLTHVVRNAVDHGIEGPEERHGAGKNPVGQIRVQASHAAGQMHLTICDDGRGIDLKSAGDKALALGLISSTRLAELSRKELIDLLFLPGVSTAQRVTELSGRGVGMDVVRANLDRLGGVIDIQTQRGAGTTVTVKLPLTLTIIRSLIVRGGEWRYAIPESSLVELVRIRPLDVARCIGRIGDAEVLHLRGRLLPLVRLANVLQHTVAPHRDAPTSDRDGHTDDVQRPGDSSAEENGSGGNGRSHTVAPRLESASVVHVAVVTIGSTTYGLIVDDLHDFEEIVVKPLGRHLKGCSTYLGATIMGDGNVALILDVGGIAAQCALAMPDAIEDSASELRDRDPAADEKLSVLLFTNAPEEQFAVPLKEIARIERIRADEIEGFGGRLVLRQQGAGMPLLALEDHTAAAPRQDADSLCVLVVGSDGRKVGLIAPRVLDAEEVEMGRVDVDFLREPGIAGSAVIRERTTLLIDVPELIGKGQPCSSRRPEAPSRSGNGAPTVLVVEDSRFFLNRIGEVLTQAGCHVVGVEDGRAALDTLMRDPTGIDLVVTDIEMPNMDGYELAGAIKSDPSLAHLKVIALTSLASEDDAEKGYASGIDMYLIKLNEEELLATVADFLHRSGPAERQHAARLH